MSDRPQDDGAARDLAFDATARAVHARALDAVPARTRLALRAAARGHAGERAPARRGWLPAAGWAFAGAGALALAVGIGLRPGAVTLPDAAPATGPALAALDAADADARTAGDAFDLASASFDEDPGLYLWLASADAQPLAME